MVDMRWKARSCAAFLSALIAQNCGSTPTPVQPTKPVPGPILLRPICAPVGSDVHCTVVSLDKGISTDVTAAASWSASDNWSSIRPTPVATVSAPGIIAPLRAGNIYIFASYGGSSEFAGHSYAVDPMAPAVSLAPYLTGLVREVGSTSALGIPDVFVEILDPSTEAGKSDVTRSNGYYFIDHVPMNTPLTARASKPGYLTATNVHPGISDDPVTGTPLNDSLHFELQRAP
jgi:hypothetical protein